MQVDQVAADEGNKRQCVRLDLDDPEAAAAEEFPHGASGDGPVELPSAFSQPPPEDTPAGVAPGAAQPASGTLPYTEAATAANAEVANLAFESPPAGATIKADGTWSVKTKNEDEVKDPAAASSTTAPADVKESG